MLVIAFVQPVAAALQLRAFGPADLDVFEVALQLALIDGRAHVGGFVETVADTQFASALDKAADKLSIDSLFRNDAAGRGAALAGGAESTPQRAFNREIQIRVVKHDHGILATQFK